MEKKNIIASLFLLGILFFSCQHEHVELGEATNFFPSTTQLQEGIANKYYEHHIPDNKDATHSTNIIYRTYQAIQPDLLKIKSFDAAMRIRWNMVVQIKENQFKIQEIHFSNLVDTFEAQIETTSDILINWANNTASLQYKIDWENNFQTDFSSKQIGLKDTLIDGRKGKMITSNFDAITISDNNDSTFSENTIREIYAEKLGLYARYYKGEDVMIYSELVEQMPLKDFKKKMNHGKKRMAYIDPSKTLDDHSDFKICNEEIRIGDYYNCNNRGQIEGGKGTWWRILAKELDTKKLKNESGYLTFRFVLNCKGDAGRFITEEADLDFRKKQFDEELVSHFFKIISKQKKWQACDGKRGSRDAYTYITFKLKDGKVIEILP